MSNDDQDNSQQSGINRDQARKRKNFTRMMGIGGEEIDDQFMYETFEMGADLSGEDKNILPANPAPRPEIVRDEPKGKALGSLFGATPSPDAGITLPFNPPQAEEPPERKPSLNALLSDELDIPARPDPQKSPFARPDSAPPSFGDVQEMTPISHAPQSPFAPPQAGWPTPPPAPVARPAAAAPPPPPGAMTARPASAPPPMPPVSAAKAAPPAPPAAATPPPMPVVPKAPPQSPFAPPAQKVEPQSPFAPLPQRGDPVAPPSPNPAPPQSDPVTPPFAQKASPLRRPPVDPDHHHDCEEISIPKFAKTYPDNDHAVDRPKRTFGGKLHEFFLDIKGAFKRLFEP